MDTPVYFRHWPYFADFCIIMILASLNTIDQMYLEDHNKAGDGVTKADKSLYNKALKSIRRDYPGTYMFCLKFKERSQIFIVLLLFIYIFWSLYELQVSVISWIFFTLLLLIFALIGKCDNKPSTLSCIVVLSTLFKYYTAVMIIAEVIFVTIFGSKEDKNNSYNTWLKKDYSNFYNQL